MSKAKHRHDKRPESSVDSFGQAPFQTLASALSGINAADSADHVMAVVRAGAGGFTEAAGASLVSSRGPQLHATGQAVPASAAWKNHPFPAFSCLAAWAMGQDQTAIVEDVDQDHRLPVWAYGPASARSLVMVPLGEPGGEPRDRMAIGVFWSRPRQLDAEEITLLQALAHGAWEALLRIQTQERLQQSEDQLNAIFTHAPVGLSEISLRGQFLSANHELCRQLGRAHQALMHMSVPDVTHPADTARSIEALQGLIASGEPVTLDKRYVRPNGTLIWARSILSRLDDARGRPDRILAVTVDLSDRRETDLQIWQHANCDALTGLPNRRLFGDRLEQEVLKTARSRQQLALLFIDLDEFKRVNDLLGHDAGDQLLVQAAQRLGNCVRRTDTVARIGGDEFTVILGEMNSAVRVAATAQKIVDTLARPYRLGKEITYISASVGVTLYPDDARTAKELMRAADQAMYAAKSNGKAQFAYFTRSMDEQVHKRLRMTEQLRHALARKQLQVHYQPIIHLSSGQIVKAEALLRWHHPTLGSVPPSVFIPLAEETGLIQDIGNWVFRQAALCAKCWSAHADGPFQVSINKSPLQFHQHGTTRGWLELLQRLGLAGQSISIEITEGVLLNASKNVRDSLLSYQEAGIEVAIDDFGTGYSSQSYLKQFHIDYLKIDQSFVSDMAENTTNQTIAETIIVMAHKLGLKVIAEGIESERQLALLKAAGCDYGQGFLFSGPLTAHRLERLLQQQSGTCPKNRCRGEAQGVHSSRPGMGQGE